MARYLMLALFMFAVPAAASDFFGEEALNEMHAANAAKFATVYRGKTYTAALPIVTITESIMERGAFSVRFVGTWRGLICKIADQNSVRLAATVNKGDTVYISGRIDDHFLGDVILKPCSIQEP